MVGVDNFTAGAVLRSNDQTAAKLIRTLAIMGLSVPEVRVAGFDDVRYATLLTIPLTTIHQPCRAIGQAAVRLMQKRLHHPDRAAQQVLLPFTLIVRADVDILSLRPKVSWNNGLSICSEFESVSSSWILARLEA